MGQESGFGLGIGVDRTRADQATNKTAAEIFKLAEGLTTQQFTDAISIALEDASRFFILSSQPAQGSNE